MVKRVNRVKCEIERREREKGKYIYIYGGIYGGEW